MGKSMGIKQKLLLPLALLAMLTGQSTWAGPAERAMAKRIHDRLTGVNATNVAIDTMEALILAEPACGGGATLDAIGCGKDAAEYAIDTAQNSNAYAFYNVTLKNFAAPWTNEEQTVFAPLNDYTATVVGAIRDGLDFRRILYDDLLYRGSNSPAYSNSNNNHYEALETLNPETTGNLANPAILQQTTQTSVRPTVAPAGIMTSRAGAMAFFSDGTNRAMFRFTLMNHLCTDLEPLKDETRAPDRVRRDVSRSPGGDSRIFLNNCVGCHAGMDGMAGAFAFYEWSYTGDKSTGSLTYTPGAVTAKHNINQNNFEYGYLTTDDSWVNYWRNGPNSKLGVRFADDGPAASGWGPLVNPDANGNETGNGARSLGIELANSRAFAQCQVDKAFKAVCLRDPNVMSTDRSARDGFVSNFVGSGYNMREVFTDVAAYCKGS
ncbi:MAG: hypothetical protein JSU67_07570 [Gammaproteobacteria bacterium]|nr:MAG: hypothetical protein JSU67_07570 [Gammaproteobacteria bacterium]